MIKNSRPSSTLNAARVDPAVFELYEGDLDLIGLNRLFPNSKLGCINFGYWDEVPDEIDINTRLVSQIKLYNKVFSYAHLKKNMVTLEVGCGRGHGINILTNMNINAWGIDPVNKQIQTSQYNYPNLSGRFHIGAADKMPFLSEFFDRVFSVETAQHFPDFALFVREAFRVLKNNGMLIVATFFYRNEESKIPTLKIIPGGISGTHYMISIEEAECILKLTGYKNLKTHSIGSKTFYGFCQWAKQQSLENTTPHSARWFTAFEKGLIDYFVITCEKHL